LLITGRIFIWTRNKLDFSRWKWDKECCVFSTAADVGEKEFGLWSILHEMKRFILLLIFFIMYLYTHSRAWLHFAEAYQTYVLVTRLIEQRIIILQYVNIFPSKKHVSL